MQKRSQGKSRGCIHSRGLRVGAECVTRGVHAAETSGVGAVLLLSPWRTRSWLDATAPPAAAFFMSAVSHSKEVSTLRGSVRSGKA